jgi:hypothetical protein
MQGDILGLWKANSPISSNQGIGSRESLLLLIQAQSFQKIYGKSNPILPIFPNPDLEWITYTYVQVGFSVCLTALFEDVGEAEIPNNEFIPINVTTRVIYLCGNIEA